MPSETGKALENVQGSKVRKQEECLQCSPRIRMNDKWSVVWQKMGKQSIFFCRIIGSPCKTYCSRYLRFFLLNYLYQKRNTTNGKFSEMVAFTNQAFFRESCLLGLRFVTYRHICVSVVDEYELGFFSVHGKTDHFLNIILWKKKQKQNIWINIVSFSTSLQK